MKKNVIKNLIDAVVEYGHTVNWNDSDIIDTLETLGVTEKDFKDCGYGEFVREYFAND